MKDSKAVIHWGGDDFFIGISPSGHAVTMDLRSERSTAAGPMELLLIALGGCTGVDVVSILEKKRMKVLEYRVEVKGEARTEFPKGFKKLEVRHILRGEGLTEEAVKQAVTLSEEKYCSVAATLRGSAEIVTSFEIESGRD
jgi:putative redox protein